MKEIYLFNQIFDSTSTWGMIFYTSGMLLWILTFARGVDKDKEFKGLILFAKILITYGVLTVGYSWFEKELEGVMAKEIKYIGIIIILVGISAIITILFQGRKKAIINKLRKINPNLTEEYLEKFDKDTLENVWIEHEREIIKKIREEKMKKDKKNEKELMEKLQN